MTGREDQTPGPRIHETEEAHLGGEIDLTDPGSVEGPLVRLVEVGT